jgi:hypothetical protein
MPLVSLRARHGLYRSISRHPSPRTERSGCSGRDRDVNERRPGRFRPGCTHRFEADPDGYRDHHRSLPSEPPCIRLFSKEERLDELVRARLSFPLCGYRISTTLFSLGRFCFNSTLSCILRYHGPFPFLRIHTLDDISFCFPFPIFSRYLWFSIYTISRTRLTISCCICELVKRGKMTSSTSSDPQQTPAK